MAANLGLVPSSAMWAPAPSPADDEFTPESIEVEVEGDDEDKPRREPDGTIVIPTDDGGVVVDFSGGASASAEAEINHGNNLADSLDPLVLATIAESLIEGFESDKRSMDTWISTRSRGLRMLGIELKEPRSNPSADGSSAVDGISTYDDPLLLQSVTTGQAKAIGEFLPANGPVKVANTDGENPDKDVVAERLEGDWNNFLTSTAREYYPDTRRLLGWVYFGGTVFRKVFHCPIRRRPAAEMVPVDCLVVSNYVTDINNADRITQIVTMRQSDLRRMVALGVYRDVDLGAPPPRANDESEMEHTRQGIEGVRPMANRPEDEPWTLLEMYATVWVEQFADMKMIPAQLRDYKVPIQFKITIEKESHQILEFVPNWDPDDDQCMPLQVFVKYSFVDWIGLYGLGMLHLVGNLTNGLTSMIREAIDTGQFANFAGFLYAKQFGQQDKNQFNVGPGQGAPVEVGADGDIRKAVMPLPYKDVSPGFVALIDKLREYATKMAGAADIPVGEGATQMPVGTVMALIEQATTVESAVHKGLHQSFSEEYEILTRLFRQDPEALWRHDKRKRRSASKFWDEQKLIQALDDWDLVPKSDPNTPSHVHRLMRAVARLQVAQLAAGIGPGIVNVREVLTETFRVLGDDAQRFINPAPPPGAAPPPDPKMIEAQAKMKDAQTKGTKASMDAQTAQAKMAEEAKNREAELTLGDVNLAKEIVIHQDDKEKFAAEHGHERDVAARDHAVAVAGHHLDNQKAASDAMNAAHSTAIDAFRARTEAETAANPPEKEGQ